ncbi:MAG: hypothetical protein IJS74_00900 [Clostridia bacterium]|nr:hypothetical protein [Clostridia bacterium]
MAKNIDDLYERVYNKTQSCTDQSEIKTFIFTEINKELLMRGVTYDDFIKGYRSYTSRRLGGKNVSQDEIDNAQVFLKDYDDKKVANIINEVIYTINKRLGESPEVKYQISGILHYGLYKEPRDSVSAYVTKVIDAIKEKKKALPTAEEVMNVLGNQYPCLRDFEDDTYHHMVVDLSELQSYGNHKNVPDYYYVMESPNGNIYFHPDDIEIKKDNQETQEHNANKGE